MKTLLLRTCATGVALLTAVTASAADFTDLKSFDAFYYPVLFLSEAKIIEGYSDGSYKPHNRINRAEFTKILIASHVEGSEIDACLSGGGTLFSDVPRDAWYAKYVCFAKQKGIIQGYSDGTFRPSAYITFVEAAKIIAEMDDEYDKPVTDPWYRGYVEWFEEHEAIPLSVCTFSTEINRGEVADMIFRIAMVTVEKDDPEEYLAIRRLGSDVGYFMSAFNTYGSLEYHSFSGTCYSDRSEFDPEYYQKKINAALEQKDTTFSLHLADAPRGEKLDAFPVEITTLPNLSSLNIFNNNISSLPPEIGRMKSLLALNIFGNKLTSLPDEFYDLTQLKYIALHANQITSISDKIANFKQLETLHLSGNPLTQEQVDHIRSLVPHAKVTFREGL